jgi:putative transposase
VKPELKPRLKRLEIYFEEHPIFFVTACTHSRRPILSSHIVHKKFVGFCTNAQTKGVFVGRYVLMPDHIHLFVSVSGLSPKNSASRNFIQPLSKWVQALKGVLSRVWRAEGLKGPFWQKSFFDHMLRSSESYSQKWEYTRANPVRAGLVKKTEEWPYQGEIFVLSKD